MLVFTRHETVVLLQLSTEEGAIDPLCYTWLMS